ncbi:nuclear transport factor 2 family protein [Balneola sp. MJW-20]|uniref:nuclear transport factor 2 family protein n=1 Tax=Gracilimonas aurantiaca TaxID=3234185 RepID=UPI0034662CA6
MKPISLLILTLLLMHPAGLSAQYESPDLKTIDGVIEALYASISGDKGVERDWATFRTLFTEDARLIPTGPGQEGGFSYRALSPEEYIEMAGPALMVNGFFEQEIHRETHRYDPIAQVFSTYTSRNTKDGPLIARGINSIQLLWTGEQWKIMTVFWSAESNDRPIPQSFDAAN